MIKILYNKWWIYARIKKIYCAKQNMNVKKKEFVIAKSSFCAIVR